MIGSSCYAITVLTLSRSILNQTGIKAIDHNRKRCSSKKEKKHPSKSRVFFLVLLSRPSHGLKGQDELLGAIAKTVHQRLIRFMLQHDHD